MQVLIDVAAFGDQVGERLAEVPSLGLFAERAFIAPR
jgi:hypothetical protein